MAAFSGRRSRPVTFVSYVLTIVIYTIAVVYIVRRYDGQNINGSEVFLKKSSDRKGDGAVNSAGCDERQQASDRSLSESNLSLTNNSRDDDDDDDEFPQQSTAAVKNNQAKDKETSPAPMVVRLLCWVMTDPAILEKAKNGRDTWMQECDVRLFMSSKTNKEFPTIGLNVSAGRNHIAEKSKAAWTYIYENHRNDAEFFVKGDPDSFIVVENLKRFLANCDPDEPAIYGHNLYDRAHFVAGEAVVLTRESLKRLVTKETNQSDCFKPGSDEDLKTCLCLAKYGGYTVDTRDENGRETFLPPFSIELLMKGQLPNWYKHPFRLPYGFCQGIDCLSHHPIVFHYVKPGEFYLMNFLIRNFRLQSSASEGSYSFRFNGTRFLIHQSVPKKKPSDEHA